MKSKVKIIVSAVLLAMLTIKLFVTFTAPISYQLFALFLAYTACVYAGAALADTRVTWMSVETGVSFIFLNFALLGLLYSPFWLVAGFMLHGIWDMMHHPKVIKTTVVKWFPPLCAIFDFIIAVFILVFF